jgi:hypothetical protein
MNRITWMTLAGAALLALALLAGKDDIRRLRLMYSM